MLEYTARKIEMKMKVMMTTEEDSAFHRHNNITKIGMRSTPMALGTTLNSPHWTKRVHRYGETICVTARTHTQSFN